uniref:Uncharacterized protein n=1 Tax=Triticum urartu TaxID=4572 RepID=A0A8R7U5C8_TRIUA
MFIFLVWKRPTRKGRTGPLIMIMFWCYAQEAACSEFYFTKHTSIFDTSGQ